jgi:hypothetical protein
MSEFKFTKGKWYISQEKHIWCNNSKIADCSNNQQSTIYRQKSNEEMGANALLISKAPEMLQDLIDIVWLIDMGATTEELHKRIEKSKQLIKEATEL